MFSSPWFSLILFHSLSYAGYPHWFLLRLVDSPGTTAVKIHVLAEHALCSRGSGQGRSGTLFFSGSKLGLAATNGRLRMQHSIEITPDYTSNMSMSADFPKACSSFPARFVTCGYPRLKLNLDNFTRNFRMPWSRKDWGSKHCICPFHFDAPCGPGSF